MIKSIIRLKLTNDICKSAGYSENKEKFKNEFFNTVKKVLPNFFYLNRRKPPYFQLSYTNNIRYVDLVIYCDNIDFDNGIKNNEYLIEENLPVKAEEHKLEHYILQYYLLYFRQLGFNIEEKDLCLVRKNITIREMR